MQYGRFGDMLNTLSRGQVILSRKKARGKQYLLDGNRKSCYIELKTHKRKGKDNEKKKPMDCGAAFCCNIMQWVHDARSSERRKKDRTKDGREPEKRKITGR